jgi:N-acyl-D-aspartate/D-glutamate deacylase
VDYTHYDAQLAPTAVPAAVDGVTTVIMGNCGVGVAPVKPETREILMQDLVNVEAIPYDVMKAGIDWQWESYGEYLDAVDRRGLGINVAGLVAFTPLRHYVMGEASFERAATEDEVAAMRRLLREAMEAGAFGFTTTTSRNHVGYQGRPLACRNASRDELVGVVRACTTWARGDRDHPELGRDGRGERRGRRAAAADHAGERPAGDVAGPSPIPGSPTSTTRPSRSSATW